MNRRQTVKLIGSGGVVAASTIVGFALKQTPDGALVLWQKADKYRGRLSYFPRVSQSARRQVAKKLI